MPVKHLFSFKIRNASHAKSQNTPANFVMVRFCPCLITLDFGGKFQSKLQLELISNFHK